MILIKKSKDLHEKIKNYRSNGKTIGFVPTMGALHQGHLSLIEASKNSNDITICSIFVNPTQFNDKNDFYKYPITIEQDILQLEKVNTDILFLPTSAEIYPSGLDHLKQYTLGFIETVMEGKYRPGHFQGVCQVVENLLNIIQPTQLLLGQKDYQQCMIITKLVELLNSPTQIKIFPTYRESNGLAMSSRNMRLTLEGKNIAGQIIRSLFYIKENVSFNSIDLLKAEAAKQLIDAGFDKIDYIEIVEARTLNPLIVWDNKIPSVALIAAYLQGVRLIDNILL